MIGSVGGAFAMVARFSGVSAGRKSLLALVRSPEVEPKVPLRVDADGA